MKYKWFLFLSACVFFSAKAPFPERDIQKLRFIGEADVPHRKSFKGTTIGGLSGIDYDAKHDLYYIISDDRSAINPARFYTAKISFHPTGIDSIHFENVYSFQQADGNVYPSSKQDPPHTPDPEGIRFNPLKNEIVWTSEGERIIKDGLTVMEDPAVTVAGSTGKFLEALTIPANCRMQATEKGPRQNGGFEGLSFSPDFKHLYFNVELPLYDDGPEPGLTPTAALIRIYKYNLETKKYEGEYAYKPEAIAHTPIPENGFKINGVPDILAIGNDKLLVIERSFSVGIPACTIKIFITDLEKAENVSSVTSLKTNPPQRVAEKKLLFNMDDLGIYIDNIEGMTFGPDLPNGHRTLIFVSDDNFQSFEKTQFLLFEVL